MTRRTRRSGDRSSERPGTQAEERSQRLGGKAAARLAFTLPGLPDTQAAGARGHWATRQRAINRWRDASALAAQVAARQARIPASELPFERPRVVFTRRSSRRPDRGNLGTSFKAVLDGLVVAGILADDSPDHVDDVYRWERTSGPPSVRVEVQHARGAVLGSYRRTFRRILRRFAGLPAHLRH